MNPLILSISMPKIILKVMERPRRKKMKNKGKK
jgi:hypothetical protein